MNLFRHEVVESRTTHLTGVVRLDRPFTFTLIALLSGICILCTTLFLTFGTVSRKVKLSDILVPVGGTLQLVAPDAGIVSEIKDLEGREVLIGQILATVRRNREGVISGTVTNAARQITSQVALRLHSVNLERKLRESHAQQKMNIIARRVSILEAEFEKIRDEEKLVRDRLHLAKISVERYKALAADGFVSKNQFQLREEEFLDLTARLHSLDRSRLVIERERKSYDVERIQTKTQLKAELLQLETAAELLQHESIERSVNNEQVIMAPFTGKITATHVEAGQALNAGQTVMSMVPSENGGATLEAQLFATSRDVGLIEIGREVRLRYGAFPFQRYGTYRGHIRSISSSPITVDEFQQKIGFSASNRVASEPRYKVVVRLNSQTVWARGRAHTLKPGFDLDADVISESSTLGSLLFEPLLAVHGKM